MLASADRPLDSVLRVFSGRGVEAGLLVPTPTGLKKSILDAHAQLRSYLLARGLHDYKSQSQGKHAKVLLKAWFVGSDKLTPSVASLYRPQTKKGDPRIWFRGLKHYASRGNVLAVFALAGDLYIANCSRDEILKSAAVPGAPLEQVVAKLAAERGAPAELLLAKLREIAAMGFVQNICDGDTGVGMTLESLLGIAANSRRDPDFHGIELKSARHTKKPNRKTLFNKVPDWSRSAISSSHEVTRRHGYAREGRWNLKCTLSNKPNAQGLYLKLENDDLAVKVEQAGKTKDVVRWSLRELESALAAKHRETFWVKAEVRVDESDSETFRYTEVEHTQSPMTHNFATLVELGLIQVDFTGHLTEREGKKAKNRDHGFPFKLKPKGLPLLFPPSRKYSLAS